MKCISDVLLPWRKFARHLPDPDIIIGAGHGTHIPMLSAAIDRGGRTVVLMQPSLPNTWFDMCLIPEHDEPRPAANICLTKGALNTMQLSHSQDPKQGTILVGGPSRHHHWNEQQLLAQIRELLTTDLQWTISDSPRTPETTRLMLARLKQASVTFQSYSDTQQGWLENRMAVSGTTWVTQDSISMIYEALTCGSAVGLFAIPVRRKSRVVSAVNNLAVNGNVVFFDDWKKGRELLPVSPPLNEADRCAELLLEEFALI